ncbi:hypothetical protein Pla110_40440 [Polystyrenella longa]|uniref:1,4-alpha-glucan branching enzyme n=1 Tax=Polystyrenella longa TaxID=2528007 RepID=A0A518CST1_9PLAN|nr:hypothetical protein [Polystyrenella longa]QDU82289.1 hypothetical protein Pla110_40440 [Polystyrenella longa]
MTTSTHTTTNPEVIQLWTTDRGGVPAAVEETQKKGDPGILRIHFPEEGSEDTLTEISWDNFFQKFEEAKLAFVYDIRTESGELSRFSKLISR